MDSNPSQEGPFTLGEQGGTNDILTLSLVIDDISADLAADVPRYAKAGTYVVDLKAEYFSQPFVSHSQRITIVVDELNAVQVVAAGTNGLEAEPGESVVSLHICKKYRKYSGSIFPLHVRLS